MSRQLVHGPLQPCPLKARGIGGEPLGLLQVLRMAELSIQLANETFNHSFVVVGMDNTCILGADFLKYGKMLVDVADAKLSWPSGEVQLRVETTTPSTNRLSALLEKYFHVFVNGPNDRLGRTAQAEHVIDTGDSYPIKQRPYRKMLMRGLIRPSTSPWSSPIVLAPKKDGNCRFCVDFRRVYSVTKKDAHPQCHGSTIVQAVSVLWISPRAIGKCL